MPSPAAGLAATAVGSQGSSSNDKNKTKPSMIGISVKDDDLSNLSVDTRTTDSESNISNKKSSSSSGGDQANQQQHHHQQPFVTPRLLYHSDDEVLSDDSTTTGGGDHESSSKWGIPDNEIVAVKDLERAAKRRIIGLSMRMWGFSERRAAVVVGGHILMLSLTKTSLKRLPDTIQNFHNLRTLNVSNNRLESLPDSITATGSCNLPNLLYLDVRNNKLQQLPDDFTKHFPKLQYLNLKGNRLQRLPATLQTLSKPLNVLVDPPLQVDMYSNLITPQEVQLLNQLGDQFAFIFATTDNHSSAASSSSYANIKRGIKVQNMHVTHLCLRQQKLSQLPPAFTNLQRLEYLNLEQNLFQKLPAVLKSITTLQTLKMDGNPLITPDCEDATELQAIQQLDEFLGNRYNHFQRQQQQQQQQWSDTGVLQIHNGRVTHLSLRMQGLLELPVEQIGRFTELRFLDLDFNHLDCLPGVLAELPNLETVQVFGNQIPQRFVYAEGTSAYVNLRILRQSYQQQQQQMTMIR